MSSSTMRQRCLLSCAALAIASATPALAAPETPQAAPDAPASAAAEAADSSSGIIVTAQRRDQSIQDVPMTLQALSGETLQQFNSTTFDDLLKYTPNVTFANNGPGAGAIFMRGLSTGFGGNQSSATIAPFPNVALYLDDQSMQFPARNVDVYLADIERVEVLEGPQGTLFGGGAEAGAVRYITNKPRINKWSADVTASAGGTAGGAANGSFTAAINIPVITDKLAVRVVGFADRQGGYIDNVRSNFTRSNSDSGNYYFNIKPTAGLCPNGLPAGAAGLCTVPTTQQSNSGQYNNNAIAGENINPVTYTGARLSAKYDIDDQWNLLIAESLQDLDAQGVFSQLPIGSDFQTLKPLQTTIFTPSYNKDRFWNTAVTLNGEIGGFKLVYTGAYMVRHLETQQDYANYSRTGGGMYYQCAGSGTGFGSGAPYCYSPLGFWHDSVRNTHLTNEFRVSSPEDKRIRVIAGAFFEKFRIYDVMDFNYKTIPSCGPTVLAAALAGGPACIANVQPYPGSTINTPGIKGDMTAFGEDTQRGYDQTAFFGSIDFDVTPTITITGGTRYYRYKEFEVGSQYQTGTQCLNVANGQCRLSGVPAIDIGTGNVNIDANNDHVTYTGFRSKGVITWKPQPHTLVYALFSQGFRPGGFNRATKLILPDPVGAHTAQFLRPNGYDPDSLTNYEVGFKTDLFDHKVQLNVSGYYMIWENVQLGFFNPAGGFGNTSFFTNGPNYHIKGGEVQIFARPVDGLTIQGGATYNDSQQVNSPCFISNVAGSSTLGKCITQFFQRGVVVPVQNPFGTPGAPTPFAPHFQGDIRARYEWAGPAQLNWFGTVGVAYTGSSYNQPATYPSGDGVLIPGTTQLRYLMKAYATVDASLGFRKDTWSLQVFGKNLTNTHVSTFTSSAQFIKSETPVHPLTYGVKFTGSF